MSDFPRTREQLPAETIDHLVSLERAFVRKEPIEILESGGPDRGARPDFDVILAGGGLSLVYGVWLARAGLRVAIFDRRKIGCGHREWNISRAELQPLADAGLFAHPDELIIDIMRSGRFDWDAYDLTPLGLGSLVVDTTDAYVPGIDEIADFAIRRET